MVRMRKAIPMIQAKVIILAGLLSLCHTPMLIGAAESTATDQTTKTVTSISEQPSYRIGPGDILSISVWKEAALTKQVVVLPDGYITFPLIGLVKAEGRTVDELQAIVESKLTRFIPKPSLSVSIEQIRSLYVYVIGKVNKSGRFELNANVTVLEALAMAGGLNPFAKKNQIRIFRKNNAETIIFDFDYSAVSRGQQLNQNILLKRGDIVVVP